MAGRDWSISDALDYANRLANHGWRDKQDPDTASSCIYALCRKLSTPARNCDRFNSGPEALGAYDRRLPSTYLRQADKLREIHDFAAWLYAAV